MLVTSKLSSIIVADCQYDWSTKTVPKLPTMFTIPKMNPDGEVIVARLGAHFSPAALSQPVCSQWSYVASNSTI